MTTRPDICRARNMRWGMLRIPRLATEQVAHRVGRTMKTMRVGLIAISLAFAGPTSAETVAPPSPSKKPASIPLDPELVRRLEIATAGLSITSSPA